jgi:hypothetical protein
VAKDKDKEKQVTAATDDKPVETTPPPLDDKLIKPEGGPEPVKKPDPGKIDPADTHNPFRK